MSLSLTVGMIRRMSDLTQRLMDALGTAVGQYGQPTGEQRNEWEALLIEARDKAPAAAAFDAVQSYLCANGWYQDGDDPGLWLPDQVTVGVAFAEQLDRDGFHAGMPR